MPSLPSPSPLNTKGVQTALASNLNSKFNIIIYAFVSRNTIKLCSVKHVHLNYAPSPFRITPAVFFEAPADEQDQYQEGWSLD